MRELLFRGFHPCDGPDTIVVDGEKVKGRWVEGYYVERDNKSWIYPASNQMISRSLARELSPFHSAKSTQKIMKEVFPVLPSTVGQYTGLTDNAGNQVFEGDILKIAKAMDGMGIFADGCGRHWEPINTISGSRMRGAIMNAWSSAPCLKR